MEPNLNEHDVIPRHVFLNLYFLERGPMQNSNKVTNVQVAKY